MSEESAEVEVQPGEDHKVIFAADRFLNRKEKPQNQSGRSVDTGTDNLSHISQEPGFKESVGVKGQDEMLQESDDARRASEEMRSELDASLKNPLTDFDLPTADKPISSTNISDKIKKVFKR